MNRKLCTICEALSDKTEYIPAPTGGYLRFCTPCALRYYKHLTSLLIVGKNPLNKYQRTVMEPK